MDPDAITLTAICTDTQDNLARFRIRNENAQSVTVQYDVYRTDENGTVTVDANSETFVVVNTSESNEATVRLFYGGEQIDVKANNPEFCDLGEPNPQSSGALGDITCVDGENALNVSVTVTGMPDSEFTVRVSYDSGGGAAAVQTNETDADGNFSGNVTIPLAEGETPDDVRLFPGSGPPEYEERLDIRRDLPLDCRPEPAENSVVFNGCGNAIVTAPDLDYPVTVDALVFNPGQGPNSGYQTVERTLASSGGSVASSGGKLVAIRVPELGTFQNPAFDESDPSAQCAGGANTGVPSEEFPPLDIGEILDDILPIGGESATETPVEEVTETTVGPAQTETTASEPTTETQAEPTITETQAEPTITETMESTGTADEGGQTEPESPSVTPTESEVPATASGEQSAGISFWELLSLLGLAGLAVYVAGRG